MGCTIKAQVMGQRIVIERQNVKLRYFLFTMFSPVMWIISLLTRKDAAASFLVSSEIIHITGLNIVNRKYLSLTFCLSITIRCPMTWAFIVQPIHSGIVSPWLKDSKGAAWKQCYSHVSKGKHGNTDNKQVVKLRTLCQLLLLWFSTYYPTTVIPNFPTWDSISFKSKQWKTKTAQQIYSTTWTFCI